MYQVSVSHDIHVSVGNSLRDRGTEHIRQRNLRVIVTATTQSKECAITGKVKNFVHNKGAELAILDTMQVTNLEGNA